MLYTFKRYLNTDVIFYDDYMYIHEESSIYPPRSYFINVLTDLMDRRYIRHWKARKFNAL